MSLTAEKLKATGRLQEKDIRKKGCWEIVPPLELVAITDSDDGKVKKGMTLKACKFDESGTYPNHLHFHPDLPFWWHLSMFDIKT